MVAIIRLSTVYRFAKSTVQKHYRKYKKRINEKHNNKCITVVDNKSQAVSDGELNMSARGHGGSSSSLPGCPAGEAGHQANNVLSWAVCFEKLLEDPVGVRYFTAFLKSEVSEENILFWQACEKFKKIPARSSGKLKEEAATVYNTYLSDSAPYSVNIDDTARIEKQYLQQPTPHMFDKAQSQVFKLMKMDSYRRFVRSPLYLSCTVASVGSKPLPTVVSKPTSKGSWEDMFTNNGPVGKSTGTHQKRGSLGAIDVSQLQVSQIKSNSSVELGSLFRQIQNGRSSPCSPEHAGGSLSGLEGGYCCVYLPDGSASLAPAQPGLLLRDMLASLCEKRGFPLKDVVIYLRGKDKLPVYRFGSREARSRQEEGTCELNTASILRSQQRLSLDQDCSLVKDKEVDLELRVTIALEVLFTGKTVGVVVKSSKKLQDALAGVLLKHQLKPQDAIVTMAGCPDPINMSTNVFKLANKKLQLDKIKGPSSSRHISTTQMAHQSKMAGALSELMLKHSENPSAENKGKTERGSAAGGVEIQSCPESGCAKPKPQPKPRLMDMLSKAQFRADDQRGLLTKEHLTMPVFLRLPSDEERVDPEGDDGSISGSSTTHTTEGVDDGVKRASSSAEGAKSADSKKDLKETTL